MKRIYNGKELEQMVSYTIAWSKLANYINQSKKGYFQPLGPTLYWGFPQTSSHKQGLARRHTNIQPVHIMAWS